VVDTSPLLACYCDRCLAVTVLSWTERLQQTGQQTGLQGASVCVTVSNCQLDLSVAAVSKSVGAVGNSQLELSVSQSELSVTVNRSCQ